MAWRQAPPVTTCGGPTCAPPHPRLPTDPTSSWKPDLAPLPTEQLVHVGKEASLEHRRHLLDPTLLGLHEVRAAPYSSAGDPPSTLAGGAALPATCLGARCRRVAALSAGSSA